MGRAGGDELLKQFGARLQACVRQSDMVARLAGDEFVVIIEGLEQPEGARCVAAQIIEAMHIPLVLAGIDRSITTSIGIAIADTPNRRPRSVAQESR
ncbi:MAG: GGDEF domain-containing protein [Oxalobacteraceae bacterium]|nr:MAG: GGDEF domain-containing protein [Oxalobacteraceae bacterium]